MVEYVKANQAVVITPFLLMGAMSPVSLPATLVQQMAEALAGIALAQLDPPRRAGGVRIVSVQHRHAVGLARRSAPPSPGSACCAPARSRATSGCRGAAAAALNASQTVDAQAAYESLMTLLPTFLAGTNFVMHSAGWLEGGLVSCYEKFIVDVELLRELRHEFTPLEIDEASLAFDAHQEVGAGGHFLGAAHTLERFRECFYRPLLSSTENFDRWTKRGARDTTARAGEIWRETLEDYEQPPLDGAIDEPSSRSSWCGGAPSWATDALQLVPAEVHRDGLADLGDDQHHVSAVRAPCHRAGRLGIDDQLGDHGRTAAVPAGPALGRHVPAHGLLERACQRIAVDGEVLHGAPISSWVRIARS